MGECGFGLHCATTTSSGSTDLILKNSKRLWTVVIIKTTMGRRGLTTFSSNYWRGTALITTAPLLSHVEFLTEAFRPSALLNLIVNLVNGASKSSHSSLRPRYVLTVIQALESSKVSDNTDRTGWYIEPGKGFS